jgi:hypothetical protein
MRALCGAIITAGALIGLGLTAVGIGSRYSGFGAAATDGRYTFFRFQDLDTGLMFILVALTASLLIGLAVAFLGLAYHHERRHHERILALRGDPSRPSTGLNMPA